FWQPIPCAEPMVAFQNLVHVWISSPSPPESPRVLLGVGLWASRPALLMLDGGKPRAHTPRGSSGEMPARISLNMMVLEVPSVISVSLEPKLAAKTGPESTCFNGPADVVRKVLPPET